MCIRDSLEGGGVRRVRQARTNTCGELDDAVPALGRFEHAADRREAALLEEPGTRLVRPNHEVLDQLFGGVLLVGAQTGEVIPVEDRLRLSRVHRERAAEKNRAKELIEDFM